MDENGEWRRLHNEELHSLYRSPNIVRVINIEMGRTSSRMEEGSSAFKMLTGKPTGKTSLESVGADGRTILRRIHILEKQVGLPIR